MPCNEPRIREIEERIAKINQGDPEAYEGEKTDLIEEQKKLYKFEQDFPHVLIPPEEAKGESTLRYFRTDDEKKAFLAAYVSLRAVKQARQVLEKKWAPKRKQAAALADEPASSDGEKSDE